MQYQAPGAVDLGPTKRFDGAVVEDGFLRLRRVLNGTIGCYQRPSGHNILNDRSSLGADSVQPGATVEVFRTEPAATGPQSYAPSLAGPGNPSFWGEYSQEFYAAGSSISFCFGGPRSASALVTYEVGLEKSRSSHLTAQAGYTYHEVTCTSELYVRHESPSSGFFTEYAVPGSKVQRRQRMLATAERHMATSLVGQGVFDALPGALYSVWVKLEMVLTTGVAPSSPATFMQFMSPSSTMTATLIKV